MACTRNMHRTAFGNYNNDRGAEQRSLGSIGYIPPQSIHVRLLSPPTAEPTADGTGGRLPPIVTGYSRGPNTFFLGRFIRVRERGSKLDDAFARG